MKLAFERTGARHRRAFWSSASFYRKRLSLVEQLEKNGLNKEIRRTQRIREAIVNQSLTMLTRNAVFRTQR
jgi:hypothetical protein